MIHRKKIVLYLTAAAVCIGLCSCTPSLPETEETFDREGIVSEDGIYESSVLGEDSALNEESALGEGSTLNEGSALNESSALNEDSALNESSTLSEDSIVNENQVAGEEKMDRKQAAVVIPDDFADTVPQEVQEQCLSIVEINLETGERMIACALPHHYNDTDDFYDVQIYRLGESEPFQTFQDSSMMEPDGLFGLADINGDGIQDLFTTQHIAQNSKFGYYVWSPSQEKYLEVALNDDISETDPLTHRFYSHLHGSAIDGQNYTYQWVGEAEIECIRSLCTELHYVDPDNRDVEVDIYISDAATGEISIDYEYDKEEYDERYLEIWDIYSCTDFFWYGEYESMGGHAYQIWYGQKRWLSDEDPNEILYEDKLYVYTPEGYLESLIEEEASAAAKEIVWDETTATLCITYEDGSIKSYQVDE